jgi:phosphatidylglycerol:prolipoprotein diacylglycerol transferase
MSYPYLSDAVRDLTGLELPLPIATFGLMVGLAMLAAAYFFARELQRMHAAGQVPSARRLVKGKLLEMPPQDVVADFTFAVLIAGVVGARLFHILEHWDDFLAAPMAMLFSRAGLSVFGGLIFGAIVGVVYVRRWSLPPRPLFDAIAPSMMLGYAIGRIGCQVSGDGDWGTVANMALKPDWLPMWAWAQTYDNNIYGSLIEAPGVYPAPIYETLMCLAGFALLWSLRKHRHQHGWLFSVYMVLAGIERLLIEQIRVNPVLQFGPVHATQAQLIAVALLVAGIAGIVMLNEKKPRTP